VTTQDGYDWPTQHPVAPEPPKPKPEPLTARSENCGLSHCHCMDYRRTDGGSYPRPLCRWFIP
jgi:hypothetical protein